MKREFNAVKKYKMNKIKTKKEYRFLIKFSRKLKGGFGNFL